MPKDTAASRCRCRRRGRRPRQLRCRPHQLHAPHQQLRAGDRGPSDRRASWCAQRRRRARPDDHIRYGRVADADVAGGHAGARQGRRRRQGCRPRSRGRRRRPHRLGVAAGSLTRLPTRTGWTGKGLCNLQPALRVPTGCSDVESVRRPSLGHQETEVLGAAGNSLGGIGWTPCPGVSVGSLQLDQKWLGRGREVVDGERVVASAHADMGKLSGPYGHGADD